MAKLAEICSFYDVIEYLWVLDNTWHYVLLSRRYSIYAASKYKINATAMF